VPWRGRAGPCKPAARGYTARVMPTLRPAPSTPSHRPARWPLLLAALLLGASAAAQAQYKWKDANGRVHLSDLPPPREVPDKDVLQRPPAPRSPAAVAVVPGAVASAALPARPASAARQAPMDPELEARRRRAEQDAQAKARADEAAAAEQRAENCQRARHQLALLDSGRRMVRQNAKGETEVLDDAARAAETQRARQVVTTDCR